jgi:hypothetical protein
MLTDVQQILADRAAATCDPHPHHPLTEHYANRATSGRESTASLVFHTLLALKSLS